MKTLDRLEAFFKNRFRRFFKQIIIKNAIFLAIGFETVSQIGNHCQISCWFKLFCYIWVNDIWVNSQDYVI